MISGHPDIWVLARSDFAGERVTNGSAVVRQALDLL